MPSQHCVSYVKPGASDCPSVLACLTSGSVPLSSLAPGALPASIKLDPSQTWDCLKTIACLTAGSIPLSALAPGALPSTVTIAPAQLTPGALPSTVTVPTSSLTGTIAPANLPPTTHTTLWDPLNNTLTDTVNGVTTVTSLASLNDEGVTLGIVGGVLQLKNAYGVIVGSVPIVDQDSQTLSLNGQVLAISNGNSITLPPSWDCLKTIACLTPGSVPLSALAPGALPSTVTVPTSSLTGTIAPANLPPTTITNAVNPTTGVVTLSVNGIAQAPIVPVETQKLTLGGTATSPTITIGGVGNTIALPPYPVPTAVTCAAIKAAYPAAAASPTVAANLLTDACTIVKMVRAVSSLGTPLNYFTIAA